MNATRFTAIVLSAGVGSRMQSDIPKQYMQLDGYPVIYYALRAFEQSEVDSIVLVTAPEDITFCRENIVQKYGFKKVCAVVGGGAERYLSVYEGLKAANAEYVLIHDGARPLIDQDSIAQSMETVVRERACVLATPVKDTIKIADQDGYAEGTPDRSRLWAVQTPQCFSRELLVNAYRVLFEQMEMGDLKIPITDDAMIVEQMTGQKVRLLAGKYSNIKITTPEDLAIAKMFLEKIKKAVDTDEH